MYKRQDTYLALRNDRDGTFKNLQQFLAKEQGFVCAYCQRVLEEKDEVIKMKVEHYQPESIYNGQVNDSRQATKLCDGLEKEREDLRIEYHNLLAVCLGKYSTSGETHCDTPPNGKADVELCAIKKLWSKEFKKLQTKIKYTNRCGIFSEDVAIDKELNDVLNLNEENLKKKRRHIWNGVAKRIAIETGTKDWEKIGGEKVIFFVKSILEKYKKRKPDGKFFEFYDCIVYLLEKKVRMLNS